MFIAKTYELRVCKCVICGTRMDRYTAVEYPYVREGTTVMVICAACLARYLPELAGILDLVRYAIRRQTENAAAHHGTGQGFMPGKEAGGGTVAANSSSK